MKHCKFCNRPFVGLLCVGIACQLAAATDMPHTHDEAHAPPPPRQITVVISTASALDFPTVAWRPPPTF
jgi:hypothetical protein